MAADESPLKVGFGVHLGTENLAQAIGPETPFRIAIVGDFSGRAQTGKIGSETELARQRPRRIDRDNFEEVMQQLDVRLERLLITQDQESVSLQFESMDDFDPDVLFEKLDAFASLRALRERLLNPDTFDSAAQEVLSWSSAEQAIAETEPESVERSIEQPDSLSADHLLDEILNQAQQDVQLGTGCVEIQVQRLVAEIAAPYAVPASDPRQQDLVGCVDSAIQSTMLALLQHPGFKQLESDWRALHQLVFDLETDASLKLYVIDISKSELAADLLASDDLTKTFIDRLLVEEPLRTPGGQPWAMVVASFYFGSGEHDATILGRLARIAAASGAPLVAGAQSSVVGCVEPDADPDSGDWQPGTSAHWQQLRELPESAYLGLLWPRFLLRLPYGKSTKPIDGFAFEEIASVHDKRRLLWGNPAFLVASMLGQSFTRSGWDLALGEVCESNDFPVWVYQDDGESHAHPSGEWMLNEDAISHVAACGVMPVISFLNQAKIRVGGFHSVHGTPLRGRWT